MADIRTSARAAWAEPHFRNVGASLILSELGEWAGRFALAVLVFDRTGSATAVGLVMGAYLVAYLGPGQLLTAMTRRRSHRSVLVGADCWRALMFLIAIMPVSPSVTIAGAAAAGLAGPPFAAARAAMLPHVVSPRTFPAALSLMGMGEDLCITVGVLLGGTLAATVGPETAVGLNVLACLASSAVLRRLPATYDSDTGDAPIVAAGLPSARAFHSTRTELAKVYRMMADHPAHQRCVLLILLTLWPVAASEALAVPIVADELDTVFAASLLIALISALSFLGGFVLLRHDDAARLLGLAAQLALAGAAVLMIGNFVPGAAGLVVLFAGAGLLSLASLPGRIVLSPRIPGAVRTVFFAVMLGLVNGLVALVSVLAGVLSEHLGARPTIAVLAVPALLVGGWALCRPMSVPADPVGRDRQRPADAAAPPPAAAAVR